MLQYTESFEYSEDLASDFDKARSSGEFSRRQYENNASLLLNGTIASLGSIRRTNTHTHIRTYTHTRCTCAL